MQKKLFQRKPERARIDSSPAREYLDLFAATLEKRRYPTRTISRYVFAADRFARWLNRQGQAIQQIHEPLLEAYVRGLGRRRRAGYDGGRLPHSAFGVRRFVEFLREMAVVAPARADAPPTAAELWLDGYDQHLERVAGLAAATRLRYCRYAGLLITQSFADQAPDWTALTPDGLADFVRQEATRLKSATRLPVTAIRALVRFLVLCGSVRAGMEAAVPTVRQWRHASLPKGLTPDEVQRVLSLCESEVGAAVRDRAILLLLARLGLRAGEVAALQLDQVRWSRGEILIGAGKSGRERLLPLSEEIGNALVGYVRRRERNDDRRVFLTAAPPYEPLTPAGVSTMAGRYLRRAGLPTDRCCAHALRHTVATQMVQKGASFKQVADVLGHARLETTAIYAKLDLEGLSRLAMPWPGGAP